MAEQGQRAPAQVRMGHILGSPAAELVPVLEAVGCCLYLFLALASPPPQEPSSDTSALLSFPQITWTNQIKPSLLTALFPPSISSEKMKVSDLESAAKVTPASSLSPDGEGIWWRLWPLDTQLWGGGTLPSWAGHDSYCEAL